MNMKWLYVFLFTVVSHVVSSQNTIPIDNLPDSMVRNADEIIIYDSTYFHVRNINESYLVRNYKIAVLKDPHNQGKGIYLSQDKFKNVDYVKLEIRSADGTLIKNAKLKDFQDVSIKGFSLASDNRLLYYHISESKLPYYVEVSYKIDYSGSMFYPLWKPQEEKVSLISAWFSVESEVNNSFRVKSINIDPIVKTEDKVQWSIQNLPPYQEEYYADEPGYYGPLVYTAPNQFQMDLVEGDMSSWKSFGDWIGKLNFERDDLDPAVFDDLNALIPKEATDLDKVKLVYDYMQGRTRYVSIQLGIGGWQPHHTNFVHETGYGDCKALSYYTHSLLTRVGVESYYTLIRAGEFIPDFTKDFPMSQFNHAILTVPLEKDTIWLECTSQTNPFGYLGTFTSDRNALMVKPGESQIIRTKQYSLAENKKESHYLVKLRSDGHTEVKMKSSYNGIMIEEDNFDQISLKDKEQQLEWFFDTNMWSSMKVKHLNISEPTDEVVPVGLLDSEFILSDEIKNMGRRLFIPINRFIKSDDLVIDKSERRFPFKIRYNKSYIDSLMIEIPDGYQVEAAAKQASEASDFGSFNLTITNDGDRLLIMRNLSIKAGKFESDRYDDFQDFVSKVKRTESWRLVLVNRT